MRYKINEERILEILTNFDKYFYIENNTIYLEYIEYDMEISDEFIEEIKNKNTNNKYGIATNVIIEKLNSHFDECFEEVEQKVSLEKCVKFLKDLNIRVEEEYGDFVAYTDFVSIKTTYKDWDKHNLNIIVNKLNNVERKGLKGYECVIYTVLNNNRNNLLED